MNAEHAKPLWIVLERALEERSAEISECREAVKNWPLRKPHFLGELRVRMERIQVSGQSIEQSLFGTDRFAHFELRSAILWRSRTGPFGRSGAAESAGVSDDQGPFGFEENIGRSIESGLGCEGHLRETLQVVDPNESGDGLESGRVRDGTLQTNDLREVDDLSHVRVRFFYEGHESRIRGDDGEGRIHLGAETLVKKLELIASCADAEAVEDWHFPVILKVERLGLKADGG